MRPRTTHKVAPTAHNYQVIQNGVRVYCSVVGIRSTRAATHVPMAALLAGRPKGPLSRSRSIWVQTNIRRSVTRCSAYNSGATLTVAPSVERQWEEWHSGEREPYCIFESESDYNTFVRVLEVRLRPLHCTCGQGMPDQGSRILRAASRRGDWLSTTPTTAIARV